MPDGGDGAVGAERCGKNVTCDEGAARLLGPRAWPVAEKLVGIRGTSEEAGQGVGRRVSVCSWGGRSGDEWVPWASVALKAPLRSFHFLLDLEINKQGVGGDFCRAVKCPQ